MSETDRGTEAAAVQAAADALVAAFAQNRVGDYFAAFAPEATFLFHATPGRLGSTAEYRELWRRWVEEDGFQVLGCTSSGPLVQVLGGTAVFSHQVETRIATRTGTQTLHESETIVFSRQDDGRWLAVHEHLSPAAETGTGGAP
ncbi:YybH family protein [Actinomadura scrupuli]|uniref:YybH family protein n=1 Tax=Actinomadura scrupuli TaxID=559629 RepID=UPI003D97CE93